MLSIEHVIVVKRSSNTIATMSPKDVWWHDIIENSPSYCEPEIVDSMHPLYILFTSVQQALQSCCTCHWWLPYIC
jgi:acetyl-CoA synthetase